MVRFVHFITAITAVLASAVTAAPLWDGSMRAFSGQAYRSDCLPTTSLREYQPFKIESIKLGSYLAKEFYSNFVVGSGSSQDTLEVCVVTGDGPCNPKAQPYCIRQNVNYRIRVERPVEGYLMAQDNLVQIIDDIVKASYFQLYEDDEFRIGYRDFRGEQLAITTNSQSKPVTLEKPEKDIKQSFQLHPTFYYRRW
ncbi:MAG: hypothetical protein J3Q66DRAFT_169659 [Benniella sp.]|nr:MAG: hypothetical protein J3Q66DRAFT_169659 [Benniella sp.]